MFYEMDWTGMERAVSPTHAMRFERYQDGHINDVFSRMRWRSQEYGHSGVNVKEAVMALGS
jgi:hypothetical protein